MSISCQITLFSRVIHKPENYLVAKQAERQRESFQSACCTLNDNSLSPACVLVFPASPTAQGLQFPVEKRVNICKTGSVLFPLLRRHFVLPATHAWRHTWVHSPGHRVAQDTGNNFAGLHQNGDRFQPLNRRWMSTILSLRLRHSEIAVTDQEDWSV